MRDSTSFLVIFVVIIIPYCAKCEENKQESNEMFKHCKSHWTPIWQNCTYLNPFIANNIAECIRQTPGSLVACYIMNMTEGIERKEHDCVNIVTVNDIALIVDSARDSLDPEELPKAEAIVMGFNHLLLMSSGGEDSFDNEEIEALNECLLGENNIAKEKGLTDDAKCTCYFESITCIFDTLLPRIFKCWEGECNRLADPPAA